MTAKHYGRNADSVFNSTAPKEPGTKAPTAAPVPKAAKKPTKAQTPATGTDTAPTDERPATGTARGKLDAWDKFTVILERRQVAFLESSTHFVSRR